MSTRKLPLVAALVSTSLAAVLPVTAGAAGPEPRQITVHFGDLNLSSSAGLARLYARIERAARDVCGPEPSRHELGQRHRRRACTSAATEGAVRAVDRPMLTALHLRRTGGAPDVQLASRGVRR